MRAHGRVAASILAGVLVGCADQPTPSEPILDQRRVDAAERTARFETSVRQIAEAEAIGLTAGVRTAMTRSLTAALAELEIQPDASMNMLNDFFQRVEAQNAEWRQIRADLARTINHRRNNVETAEAPRRPE